MFSISKMWKFSASLSSGSADVAVAAAVETDTDGFSRAITLSESNMDFNSRSYSRSTVRRTLRLPSTFASIVSTAVLKCGNTRMNEMTPLRLLILTLVSSMARICSSTNLVNRPSSCRAASAICC